MSSSLSSHDISPPARTPGRRRRRFLRTKVVGTAATLAAVVFASACSPSDTEVDLSKTLPTDIPAGTTLVVADQQNLVQNLLAAGGNGENLPYQVEFANFTGGPAVLEAFRAGTADVAPVGDVPPIHAYLTGQQVPIILARKVQPDSYRFATSPEAAPTLRTGADLRSKRIAYAEGTAQQVAVLRALQNAGLTTDDVNLVRLQLVEFSEALGAGEVDVAPLNEPRLTRYLRDYSRDGASFLDPAAVGRTSEGLSYFYARGESLTDPAKAAALRHFVGVLVNSFHWINTHPAEWVKAYYVGDQEVTGDDGRRILESTGTTGIPALDDTLISTQQSTIDVIEKAGELPKPVSAADLFDLRFAPVIEEAAAAAGVDRASEPVKQ